MGSAAYPYVHAFFFVNGPFRLLPFHLSKDETIFMKQLYIVSVSKMLIFRTPFKSTGLEILNRARRLVIFLSLDGEIS